jgi:hypothetical protein
VAIHYGSFRLSEEDLHDPPKHLKLALKEENIDETEFCLVGHGATIESAKNGDVLEDIETVSSQ